MNALIGGAIIGIAVSLMLMFNGRVTGISGIIGGSLNVSRTERGQRALFILGLLAGGGILRMVHPESFIQLSHTTSLDHIVAGLLVGFGTLLGNGCTSGHGVCGISRFSVRSIVATITFILFGMISVLIFKKLRGEL